MSALVVAFVIPAIPAIVGLLFGIAKDGSPLRGSWWTE